ncbi:hypothetical protein TNCV_4435181 [Trichonephila clavipes]|nr:hypothetical protein TNCV_4435181 [Trichonephila clavipes]
MGYFNDYVAFDEGLPVGATEVEIIVDLWEPKNSDSDEETDNESPIKIITFSNAFTLLNLECVSTLLSSVWDSDFHGFGNLGLKKGA